jgi:hypothetical protein
VQVVQVVLRVLLVWLEPAVDPLRSVHICLPVVVVVEHWAVSQQQQLQVVLVVEQQRLAVRGLRWLSLVEHLHITLLSFPVDRSVVRDQELLLLRQRPVLLVHSVLNTVEQQVLVNPQQQQVVVSVDQASGAVEVAAAADATVLHHQH